MRADRLRAKLVKLFAMLGSSNPGERENARRLIDEILLKNRKTWNDLTELLQTGASGSDWGAEYETQTGAAAVWSGVIPSAIELVDHILRKYVDLREHEYVAVALWILHAHVFPRFMISPRLALLSPVRGCGKTTLLDVIERLLPRAHRVDGVSPASVYWLVEHERCTLLVDEADNLGLARNGQLRAVFNSGHRRGGSILRVINGRPKKFSPFAPIAIGAIGTLPLPLMHRSIIISMQRSHGTTDRRRLDDGDTGDLDVIYGQVLNWVRSNPSLDPNPAMPTGMCNRPADNWRPLIAIADTFGERWAAAARDAALILSRGHHDEDVGVLLLRDVRDVFDARGVDRLASVMLVAALNDLDDGLWTEYRGPNDDRHPRRLSQGELARLLRRFDIRPRTIWPLRRTANTKSAKGYFRYQFEAAWRSYCQGGPAAHPNNVRHLRSA